jgi:hypothetical protein
MKNLAYFILAIGSYLTAAGKQVDRLGFALLDHFDSEEWEDTDEPEGCEGREHRLPAPDFGE